jgi:glycosyltransferase involved in cell wall biosynthesis
MAGVAERSLRLCFAGWADHVHVERWAGHFARQGHEVHIITFSGNGSYPPGVKQYSLGLERRGMRLKLLRLRYLLHRIRPDLVHVHWAPFAIPLARVWRGPLAVTVWGSDIYRLDELGEAARRDLPEALRRATVVTGDSDDILARVRDLTQPRPPELDLVLWGVDTDAFSPGPVRVAWIRELAADGRPVVFSARSFVPMYNQESVVAAFAEVLRSHPTALLIMKNKGGDPDYIAAIRALVGKLGLQSAVRYVDTIPYEDMPDLYRVARVTVSVPLTDAMPMAVLEAMACGSLPVVSDLPSLREWIEDSQNGYLVRADDVHAHAERIVRLLSDGAIAEPMVRRNLELVRAKASQAAHMRHMEEVYRRMVEQGAAAIARARPGT